MSKNDAEREKRLAEALRANLRRRKTQARGDASAEPAQSDGDGDSQSDNDAQRGSPHDPTSDRH